MTRTYCTLYDSAYTVRGLLMIRSLINRSRGPVRVFALCLDRESAHKTKEWIGANKYEGCVSVVMLDAVAKHEPRILTAESGYSHRQFCWAMASVFTRYVMHNYIPEGEALAYCDADLWFFSDPEGCWLEMGKACIGIHEHRFPESGPAGSSYHPVPVAERIASSGRFNVGFVVFRNSAIARACLEKWCDQVLCRCDATTCGDQKYLDRWPEEYTGSVHVFRSPGIGVATWNVWGYGVISGNPPTVDGAPVVFMHYHEHRRTLDAVEPFQRSLGYPLRPIDIEVFYAPYEAAYLSLERKV